MDEARIKELTEEVLKAIQGTGPRGDLESRVVALESAVSSLEASRGEAAAEVHIHTHPGLRLLDVPRGVERCLMEPDKPCVQSGACRTFGH